MIYLGPIICFLLPLIASFLAAIYYRKFKRLERKTVEYFSVCLREKRTRARLKSRLEIYKTHMSEEAILCAEKEIEGNLSTSCRRSVIVDEGLDKLADYYHSLGTHPNENR